MGLFRFWQPHTDEYMLLWNSFVGAYTLQQLSEVKKAEVYEHYARVIALNRLDPNHDLTAFARYDPFWVAFTMADLGIVPLLGPKSAKWFYVTNPRKARTTMCREGLAEELGNKVIRDIRQKHGVIIDINQLPLV